MARVSAESPLPRLISAAGLRVRPADPSSWRSRLRKPMSVLSVVGWMVLLGAAGAGGGDHRRLPARPGRGEPPGRGWSRRLRTRPEPGGMRGLALVVHGAVAAGGFHRHGAAGLQTVA